MTLMERRRALMGHKSGKRRLYIFKDGAYQAWLNGREFFLGGYWQYITGTTSHSTPYYNLSTVDNEIQFYMHSAGNRTNIFSIGIKVSDLIPNAIKKVGGIIWKTGATDDTIKNFTYFGVSELFSQSSNINTAFGAYQFTGTTVPASEQEIEMDVVDSNNANYIVASLVRNNDWEKTLHIKELWLEV